MNLTEPAVTLGTYPTPLRPAPRLATELGLTSLLIKRDDLTGFSLGGNKVRKLEHLLAEATTQGATAIVVCGGPASNLCQTAAAAAEVVGLRCELALYGSRPHSPPLNLLLAESSGAVAHFTGNPERSSVDELALTRSAHMDASGEPAYIIPRGGATPRGALGYHRAAIELAGQLRSDGIEPEAIVVAVGSGGTMAGILSGLAAAGATWPVVGASVSRHPDEAVARVKRLAEDCSELAGVPPPTVAPDVVDARGPGYAQAWPDADTAADLARRTESLMLDPIYTAKAFVVLTRLARDLRGHIVFWHTGGIATILERVVRKDPS